MRSRTDGGMRGKMKKKWLGCALAFALSAALFSGCTGKKEAEGSLTQTRGGNEATESEDVTMRKLLTGEVPASDYVTLGEYKGLAIKATVPEYDEEDIEVQTRQFYFGYTTSEEHITDRPVQLLDMANIDYEGKKDGVAFDGGTAQGYDLLIGSGQFIEGFEEGLIGVMPGETVDLNLKFPEQYHSEELAGAEVVFTVTVNYIQVMEDAAVAGMGIDGVSTVDDLKDYVKTMLEQQADSEYKTTAQSEIWSQVMENAVFEELPESVMNEVKETYVTILDNAAAQNQMDVQTFVSQAYGMEYDAFLDQRTEMEVKQLLILQTIAEAEGIAITEDQLDERINTYAEENGKTADDLYVNGLTKEDFWESFLYEDVVGWLVDNAVK